jgi:hypothetical protein
MSRRSSSFLSVFFLVAGCAGSGDDICARALQHLETCAGVTLRELPDTCDPDKAKRLLSTQCSTLVDGLRKKSGSSLWPDGWPWGLDALPWGNKVTGPGWLEEEKTLFGPSPGISSDPGCYGVTHEGRCTNMWNMVEYCEGGQLHRMDCGSRGCVYNNLLRRYECGEATTPWPFGSEWEIPAPPVW